VGGGYPERESGLAKITLEWMIKEAVAAQLLVNPATVDEVLGKPPSGGYVPPNASAMMHDSMNGFWPILEYLPRRHWTSTPPPPHNEWILYRKRPRRIDEDCVLHQSVLDRKNDPKTGYAPVNLPTKFHVEPW
jgi:hypothetical protein